jgi:hypothetical protein
MIRVQLARVLLIASILYIIGFYFVGAAMVASTGVVEIR